MIVNATHNSTHRGSPAVTIEIPEGDAHLHVGPEKLSTSTVLRCCGMCAIARMRVLTAKLSCIRLVEQLQ